MPPYSSDIVTGRLPVLACLDAKRRRAQKLFVYSHAKGLELIVERASHIEIEYVDREKLERLSGGINHQGVVLCADPLPLLDLDAWMERHREPTLALVALDSIEDPRNLGAIVRSAAAFGAQGLLFAKDRTAPVSTAAVKAAAGAMEYMDLIQTTNLTRALQTLKKNEFWVAALDADATQPLWQSNLRGRIVFLIGSEGAGIRRLVKEQADFSIAIPIEGAITSLNASVSAGIVLAEWRRQHFVKE